MPSRGAAAKGSGGHREREQVRTSATRREATGGGGWGGRSFKGQRRTAARLIRSSTTGCIDATAIMSARSSRSTCSEVGGAEVAVVVTEVAVAATH